MSFVNENIDGQWRTIDRERNIVLINLGSAHNHPKKLQLKIAEEVINFEGVVRENFKSNQRYDVTWDIVKLYYAKFSYERRIEIIEIVREALNEYGAFARRDGVDSVTVNFNTLEMN